MSNNTQFRSLLGAGEAAVLNLPNRFSFERAAAKATRISIATAFGKLSGWSMISRAIQESRAELRLVTGLAFFLTEPELLDRWFKLQAERPNTNAYLALRKKITFHPKVMIVESGTASFGIVGSGNLTEGGLRNNVECSVFINDPVTLAKLNAWFDDILSHHAGTVELRQSDIDIYRPKFKKFAKMSARSRRDQRRVEKQIAAEHEATLARWDDAVRAAKSYFASRTFKDDWSNNWRPAIKELRQLMPAPRFEYSEEAWREFFQRWEFGHLIPIFRDVAFRRAKRTREGLRRLVQPGVPVLPRLDDILEPGGPYYVPHVGVNLVSKIMAINSPDEWPVFNGPVANVLKAFGYQQPQGASRGAKYLAFARLMKRFKEETGARSMLELDPFFYRHNKDI